MVPAKAAESSGQSLRVPFLDNAQFAVESYIETGF
jgi:hypothetical protein